MMDPWEKKEDIRRTLEILRKQKELVSSSKKEAKKLLVDLGIWHLLVPIKKAPKSALKTATKPKKASKSRLKKVLTSKKARKIKSTG